MSNTQTLKSRIIETRLENWRQFNYIQQDNFKELSKDSKERLKSSILLNNFAQPFYVWQCYVTNLVYCLDGRHRTIVMEELINEGVEVPEQLPATFIQCDNIQEAAKLVLAYSSMYAKITETGLFDFVQMYDLEWKDLSSTIDLPDVDKIEVEAKFNTTPFEVEEREEVKKVTLAERFIVPPFSVLDTRQGYWQDRKKQWHEQGINSQATREEIEIISQSGQSTAIYELRNKMREALKREPTWDEITAYAKEKGLHLFEGASIFDPVLCEIIYKWFGFPRATVLDPFAGGSVRGIVAGMSDLDYVGIDLRPDQVAANIAQWENAKNQPDKFHGSAVTWITGDSNKVLNEVEEQYDLVFSCPPYHDLEVYSDDPEDLSNMDYETFKAIYSSIIQKSVARLKDNRFACFVVSEIRDKKGWYKGFVQDTINAFEAAGAKFYNEIILLNVAGSLPIRIGRQFQGYRKVGRTHQNVLVFYKGDIKMIPEVFPQIEVPQETESEVITIPDPLYPGVSAPDGVEQL